MMSVLLMAATPCLTAQDPPSQADSPDLKRSPPADVLTMFMAEFVAITPGQGMFPKTFVMGDDDGPAAERPAHTVTLERPFAIARYEVPQNLYEFVMSANPSKWKGPRNSVEMMTWTDANRFCDEITRQLRAAGLMKDDELIRLPSEAEWEYCCRAGTNTAYSFGSQATKDGDRGNLASILDAFAWHTGNAAGNDPPVGALRPNPWGLYDMHGYLWEFVADAWTDNYQSRASNSTGTRTDRPASANGSNDAAADSEVAATAAPAKRFVIRGGSWRDPHQQLRSTTRRSIAISETSDAVGFRCVRSSVTE